MINTDSLGLVGGLIKSSLSLFTSNISNISNGKTLKWGFFMPFSNGFKFIHDLVCAEKVRVKFFN